ncbi:MAG: hypothetical protein LBE92_10935 [Chryseobacterium sp.]|jgi:hypothetical protein|uniref:hypothetical protein n=1 Tax=Chryseobacterium sp. TaxID=1871047 RepID=UPI0028241AA9|nr:hypothetical protein [Chryseobacterium sp.]MDR2236629.1 hypothetical protein [Chryseobacterium sp.]
MYKIIYIAGFLLLFACKETKPDATSSEIKKDSVEKSSDHSINKDKSDSYFIYTKWDHINKPKESYQSAEFTVRLQSDLDEARNIGGKKVYVNGKEIDFLVTDAYVFTPFILTNGSEKILLLQEEDESGTYGYRFYYFNKEKLVKKGILDIAPDDDTLATEQFITFKNKPQYIVPIIVADQYYDTSLDKIMPSAGYSFTIDKTAR